MPRAPYIGVTGFMHQREARAALEHWDFNATPADHQLMVGVLASQKTLRGETNKYPGRYPTMEQIGRIFVNDPRCLNLVHYSTDDVSTLPKQLEELEGHFTGIFDFDGYQLNMCWPDPAILAEALYPHHQRVVLQLGPRALAEFGPFDAFNARLTGGSFCELAKRLSDYLGLITDVLVDVSAGQGRLLPFESVSLIVDNLRSYFPGLGIGVAGGLMAGTVSNLRPLVEKYPRLSFDAEGRLRDEYDHLDLEKVRTYLRAAKALFEPTSVEVSA